MQSRFRGGLSIATNHTRLVVDFQELLLVERAFVETR